MTNKKGGSLIGTALLVLYILYFSFLPSSLTKTAGSPCLSGVQVVRDIVRDVRDKRTTEIAIVTQSLTRRK